MVCRWPLALVAGQLSLLTYGQPVDRLIVLSDADPANHIVQAEVERWMLDAGRFFQIQDIQHITVAPSPAERGDERHGSRMQDGMQRVLDACQVPSATVWLALCFAGDRGPSPRQVMDMLRRTRSNVKLLGTTYTSAHLSTLIGSRYSIVTFAYGEVGQRDTVEDKVRKFPWVPVIAGGGGAAAAVLLLTREKDGECDPVDPQWINSSPLCGSDPPVQMLVTGTPGGTWAGKGITPSGLFDPASGTQSVTYTVGKGECRRSLTQTIAVTLIEATWSVPKAPCAGEVITLVPQVPGGTWSGAGVMPNEDGSATFSRPVAGEYAVTYTITLGACTASEMKTISVRPDADASWSSPGKICAGTTAMLTPNGTLGGQWSGEGVSDLGNGTASFLGQQAGQYHVTYSVGEGECAASLTQTIDVMRIPDAGWSPPSSPICVSQSITLLPSGDIGGTWSGDGITDLGNGNASFVQADAGTYPATYSVVLEGCSASETHSIEVIAMADASWSVPENMCTGQAYTLTPGGTPGGLWSGEYITDQGNSTARFLPATAGSFPVTYTTGTGTCAASLTQTLAVLQTPSASWTPPADLCPGMTITLSSSGTPGGSWQGSGVTNTTPGVATFRQDQPGSYPVTYLVTNGACRDSLTQTIIVLASADPSWMPPNDPCAGTVVILRPSGTPGGTWSGPGITNTGSGLATFQQGQPGTYAVTYSVATGPCADSLTQSITVLPLPDPGWIPPADLCAGGTAVLSPTGTPGGTWSGEGISDLGNGTAIFTTAQPGPVIVAYSIVIDGCESTLAQEIIVHPMADASWTTPGSLCQGASITLTPSGTPGGQWSGEGVTDLGDGTAIFLGNQTGVILVTYEVHLGPCADSSGQEIIVLASGDPAWSPPSDVCANEVIALVPTGTPGGTWSGPGVTDLGNGTASFVQGEAGAYAVTYRIGEDTCAASLTHEVIVIIAGDPSWSPPQGIVCPGETVSLSAPSGEWSGPGVTNLGGGEGIFQSLVPGNFPVTLTVGSGSCIASETHVITADDIESPVILFPPEDLIVFCDGDGNIDDLQTWLETHGGATATDNCDANLTWTDDYTGFPFECGMAGSVDVGFTVRDDAGHAAIAYATFSILDEDAPVLAGVPANIVVPCTQIPAPPVVTADDECSGPASVSFTETDPGPDCPYTIVRSWTAMDDCGNLAYAEQVITAVDNTAPILVFGPPDLSIECPGPLESCIPPIIDAVFEDNCDPDPIISFDQMIIPLPPAILHVIRCWYATDACGNVSASYCQSILIFALEPPAPPSANSIDLHLSVIPVGASSPATIPLFFPGKATWKDQGPITPLDGEPWYATRVMTGLPMTGVEMETRLGLYSSLRAGIAFDRMRAQGPCLPIDHALVMSAQVFRVYYHLTLRWIPQPTGHFFYSLGPRYASVEMNQLEIRGPRGKINSESRLQAGEFFVGGGGGFQWPLGRLGLMEIRLEYGTNKSFGLEGVLKINALPVLNKFIRTRS